MKILSDTLLVVLSAALMAASAVGQDAKTMTPTMFDNCDIETYYASLLQEGSPSSWTQEDLSSLIKETHRNILPTHGETFDHDDLYKAIINLHPGNESGTVRLVYRDINRGYDSFSPAFTDVHHIKPAKSTVLMSKGDLSFGMCDTVEFQTECVVPASTETANDTAQDGKIWTPPPTLPWRDCGLKVSTVEFARLWSVHQWHDAYPPTEDEVLRNDKACSRWQGNRNPFIDYPQLAQSLFDFPTMAPTNMRNDCGSIQVGDVPVFLVNTKDPDEVVFLPMFDIPGGMELFVTDQAWNGTGLVTGVPNEGTMVMTTPEDGIEQGDLFGMGPGVDYGDTWSDVEGAFSLSTTFGDNVFLYCIDADGKMRFLAGFSNSGIWSSPGLSAEEYGEALTALPEQLDQGSIVLPHLENYFYNGSRNEATALLRADMLNPASWVGDNEGRYGVE
ncbi:Endonuclease I [Seminavis robusta]|uniref:Endonuclease I n=1 Tax=Seminavis robusta TaxID=568900 RepID=A0A9N8D919_9STRA|nr:Endonuclease I [Seminavis robusta]|eukprot:Sro46_g027330.1 Endonuclease I (446) ;mRNA; r:23196-24822